MYHSMPNGIRVRFHQFIKSIALREVPIVKQWEGRTPRKIASRPLESQRVRSMAPITPGSVLQVRGPISPPMINECAF